MLQGEGCSQTLKSISTLEQDREDDSARHGEDGSTNIRKDSQRIVQAGTGTSTFELCIRSDKDSRFLFNRGRWVADV